MNIGRSSASIASSLGEPPHTSSLGLGWSTVEMFHWSIHADRYAYQTFDDVLLSYHMTDGVEIDLAVNGSRRDYRSRKGLLVVVPGGSSVAFDASNRFDCWNIHLSRTCFPRAKNVNPAGDFRHFASDPQLTGLISVLAKEMRDPTQQGSLLADHLSAAIAYYLEFHASSPATLPPVGAMGEGALARVLDLIESRIERGVSLAELAAEAGLSASQLARNFRKSTGLSPHAYLQQRRIEQAARMLVETPREISEIALACGFSSQSHFTDAFRRASGCTPRQHRLGCQ